MFKINAFASRIIAGLQVNSKLARIGQNIEGTQEEIENTKDLLRTLAGCDLGRNLIMQMPENTRIIHDSNRLSDRASALFSSSPSGANPCITLQNGIKSGTDRSYSMISLAHEIRHSIQITYCERPLISNIRDPAQYITRKIIELETVLLNAVLTSLFVKDFERKHTSAVFYEQELKKHQLSGLPDKEAEKKARTSLAKILWTGVCPSYCSAEMKQYVQDWNIVYDLQTYNNVRGSYDYNTSSVTEGMSLQEIITAQKNDLADVLERNKKEIKSWEEYIQKLERGEKAEEPLKIIPPMKKNHQRQEYINYTHTVASHMDLDLPIDYFEKTFMQRTTVGNLFTAYRNSHGCLEYAMFMMQPKKNGKKIIFPFAICTFAPQTDAAHNPVCIHQIVLNHPTGIKDGLEIFKDNDGIIQRVLPWKNGILDGIGMFISKDKKFFRFPKYENGTEKYILCNTKFVAIPDGYGDYNIEAPTPEQINEFLKVRREYPKMLKQAKIDLQDDLWCAGLVKSPALDNTPTKRPLQNSKKQSLATKKLHKTNQADK